MKREFSFPSRDGRTSIHAIEWVPEGEIKGILQMCHGMVEYIDRYHDFATFLTEKGYYVVGHDHLGHGQSVVSDEEHGFFAETEGNAKVIADIHKLRCMTTEKYPDLPYFMLGHSMGSFLLRQYLGMYGNGLSGAVIMGTGAQPDVVLGAGKLLCRLIAAVKGWNYRSMLINNMAFGGYNKRFSAEKSPVAWLSRNAENVAKYEKDPLCTFVFTLNAYYNMFCGISVMNRQEREGKIPKDLPLFLVAGADDPVGNFGKSVEKLYHLYLSCGIEDVQMKLYEKDRHEILNETDRDVVYQDILDWMEERVKES